MHEDASSIPDLTQLRIGHCQELWCRSQTQLRSPISVAGAVWASSWSSNLTPNLGTYMYHRYGPKKEIKKRKRKRKKEKEKIKWDIADSWHKKKAWGCISLQCASAVLKPSGQPTHYSDWQFTPSALPDIYNRQRISVEILQWKGKRRVWSVPGMSLILLRNHQSGSCVPDLWETLLYIHIHTYIKTVS